MENALLYPSISHSINSRHAGSKNKIYEKKKRAWMLFHQKRGIQIYIKQNYTTLLKNFLTFNNQLQKLQLLPKYFNEKRRNHGIRQKSVPGLVLKKIVNSVHTFLLSCDIVAVLIHKLLSFNRWYCHIEFAYIVILNHHYHRL